MKTATIFLLTLVPFVTTFMVNEPVEVPEEEQIVFVQTMGKVNQDDLNLVVSTISDFYNFEVIVKGQFPIMDSLKVKNTNRFQANRVLKTSNIMNRDLDGKVLILTEYDICTDRKLDGVVHKNWGIFGLAGVNKQTTVISTYRMKTNHTNRLTKVTVHELGHTLGLQHCHNDEKCVMSDAKGKGSNVDGTEIKLCLECKKHI
jgi:archaemetzincin